MLQGFVIFLIFVTKPDARREIKKRIYGRGNNRNLLELTKAKATATKCRSPPSSNQTVSNQTTDLTPVPVTTDHQEQAKMLNNP